MRAQVLHNVRAMSLEDVSVPQVGRRQVLVRVLETGICGSDLATYNGRHPYKSPPVILGHEFSGTIEVVGDGVEDLQPGDLVTALSYSSCGACTFCGAGRTHLCQRRRSISHESWGGSFAEFVVTQADATIRLPLGFAPVVGALIEPLSIGAHATAMAARRHGSGASVAVLGTGSVGIACAAASRYRGFGIIVCADRIGERAETARAIGVDAFVNTVTEEFGTGVREHVGGPGADIVYVASGHAGALGEALDAVAPGGTVVIVSYFAEPVRLDVNSLVLSEKALLPSTLSTRHDVDEVIRWLSTGTFDPMRMVTHRTTLPLMDSFMKRLSEGDPEVGKVIASINQTSDHIGR